MAEELPFVPDDDDLDYLEDTAECGLCGNYYCLCCGCNCWLDDDNYEDETEEIVYDEEN